MSFHSFQIRAVGRVANEPVLETKGERTYAHIALIANDYAGQGKERIATTVFLVAFGKVAEVIVKNVRVGDQLIIDAHIRNNNYQDGGDTVYRNSFIVDDFTWGAPGAKKRSELAQGSQTNDQ